MTMEVAMQYKEPVLIVPSKPTPIEIKQLSDVDVQKGLRFHFPMIMFYEYNPCMDENDHAGLIRHAVAEALVYYYPFAGRLVEGTQNKVMVNCTGEGVLFREAMAETTLDQLRGFMKPPFAYSKEFLLDASSTTGMLGGPLMLIQVTRLICGGIVVAVRLNHVLSDGVGLVQFLHAVSQISKGSTTEISPFPVWQRELLNARNPPCITCMHSGYEFDQNKATFDNVNGDNATFDQPANLVRKGFFFGPQEIEALKRFLTQKIGYVSNFVLITAFVWRSRTIALQFDSEETVSLTFSVTLHGKNHLNLPSGYYGNALVTTAAVSKVKMLCNNSLGYAVELLIKQAKIQVNEDFINSSIDFNGTYKNSGFSTLFKNFNVSDASRTRIDEVDFGWGKPIYGGTMDGGPCPNQSVYARFRNSLGEDGVVVPLCLPLAAMEKFREEVKKMIHHEPILEDSNKFEASRIIMSNL